MTNILRTILRSMPWFRNWRYGVSATKKINAAQFDRNILSASQKKEILDFWNPYAKFSNIFHAFYTASTNRFFANYIPDSLWYGKIDPFFNPDIKSLEIDDKSLYSRLFPSSIIAHPKTILSKINGFWVNNNNEILPPPPIAIELLTRKIQFFVKVSLNSSGGHGVKYFDMSKDSKEDLEKTLRLFGDNIVIQEGIKQSPILSKLNPSSVNTIRIVSFLKNSGEVKIYSSVLRMGINGAKVDNASSGGVTVGIKEDGQLKEDAYSAAGVRYPKIHPNSKVEFSSIKIPDFENILGKIKRLHPFLPHFRLLSWDIALDTENQPILIEVNMSSGELDFHQLNNGPIFGDDTKEILDEVFGRNKGSNSH